MDPNFSHKTAQKSTTICRGLKKAANFGTDDSSASPSNSGALTLFGRSNAGGVEEQLEKKK
jgi:hypothetical protein